MPQEPNQPMNIEPVPEYLSAIECVELVESMLEHRYGTDMASLAKTDRMMAGVLALLRPNFRTLELWSA